MPRWTFIILVAFFFILGNYSFSDVGNAISHLGERIIPNYPNIGAIIVIFAVFFIAFTYEIMAFLNTLERKIKQIFK